jgi:hypothetical protein
VSYFELDDCALVVVEVAVVGGGEDGDDCGELLCARPLIHLEPLGLRLVRPDDGDDLVAFEEALRQLAPEKVGAPPHLVVLYQILTETVLVVHRVRPHQVAEQPSLRDLAETVDLADVVQLG